MHLLSILLPLCCAYSVCTYSLKALDVAVVAQAAVDAAIRAGLSGR